MHRKIVGPTSKVVCLTRMAVASPTGWGTSRPMVVALTQLGPVESSMAQANGICTICEVTRACPQLLLDFSGCWPGRTAIAVVVGLDSSLSSSPPTAGGRT